MVKVSIIMPSLNVKPYINECIESVINQTLEDIEIICVDAGSTDGTFEILQEYANNDKRMKLIKADKRSYGYQMNLGISIATGEYVGIVETDDFIEPHMYERLYSTAKKSNAQVVKANFSFFKGNGEERVFTNTAIINKKEYYACILNPQETPELLTHMFPTINCAGVYELKFLTENNIFHNETPGASYQDNGFYFQICCFTERLFLINDDLYKVRRDRPESSIYNKDNVWVILDEYSFIYDFLCKDVLRKERFSAFFWFKKFSAYYYTLNRIAFIYKLDFLKLFSDEFKYAFDSSYLKLDYFSKLRTKIVHNIMNDYEAYFYRHIYKEAELPKPENENQEMVNLKYMYKARCYKIKNLPLLLSRNSVVPDIYKVKYYQKKDLERQIKTIEASYIYKIACLAAFLSHITFLFRYYFERFLDTAKNQGLSKAFQKAKQYLYNPK